MSVKVAITGAGSGIGRALAIAYAEAGNTLYLAGRNQSKLKKLQKICIEKGAHCFISSLDVQSLQSVDDWMKTVFSEGPVDILYANAGVTNGVGEDNLPEDALELSKLLSTNMTGAAVTLSLAARQMLDQGHGQLVAISSLASYVGFSGSPAYCASKAGLKVFCESLQRLLQKSEVGLTLIFPGYVKSPMSDRVVSAKPFEMSAERAAHLIKEAVRTRKRQYGFPWILWTGVRLLSLLPYPLQNVFVPFFDYEVVEKKSLSVAD